MGAESTTERRVVPHMVEALNLKYVAFARNHLVQHGIDEESNEQTGDKPGHDDDGEGLLGGRANAGREGRRK